MSKTILVTGGAGFIGSAVVRHLINDTDHTVVNLDKLTYAGNLESLTSVSSNERYSFEQVDICDADEVKRVFNTHQPDIIMHLAAESHVDRSIDGPGEFIQTNVVGTYTLLEQARAYWSALEGEKKAAFKFHHISTDEVYGDLPHPDEVEPGTELPLFTETTPYAPSSPYSASKASSDQLVRSWLRTYKLPTLVTNCSNNYGPYHFPEKLIPLVILNALAGKPLPVYGKGNQIRDWLYVEDHVEALLLAATRGRLGESYCVGGAGDHGLTRCLLQIVALDLEGLYFSLKLWTRCIDLLFFLCCEGFRQFRQFFSLSPAQHVDFRIAAGGEAVAAVLKMGSIVDVGEEGCHGVKISTRVRIVFVVMALGAPHGGSHPDL